MVVKMKRITLIGPYLNKEKVLDQLQNAGVVDIIEKDIENIQEIEEKKILDDIQKALKILNEYSEEEYQNDGIAGEIVDWDDAVELSEKVLGYHERIETLNSNIVNLKKAIDTQQQWGDFNYDEIAELERKHNISFQFWSTPNINKIEFEEGQTPIIVNEGKKSVFFITISENEYEAIAGCSETKIMHSVTHLSDKLQEDIEIRNKLQARLNKISRELQELIEKEEVKYQNKLDYELAKHSLTNEIEGKVYILEGWCPVKELDTLKKRMDKYSVHMEIDAPTREDDVPVTIKNSPLTRLFEPITKLFMLPDYFELDLTALFAPLFWLFFGLCLGDAGWGGIILIAGIIGSLVIKKQAMRRIMMLGILLGISTVAVGLLTGSLMGFDTRNIPVLSELVLFDNQETQSNVMFRLSLIIGMFQINLGIIANIINSIRNEGLPEGIFLVGKMILIDTLFLLMLPMIDIDFALPPMLTNILLIGSLALVLLFNSRGNIFLRPLKGIWELYQIVSGFFGDMLSYTRLFALGLAGSILGQVINEIGSGFLSIPIPILNYVVYFGFLIIFHGLMMALNALGSFVHPLRLTFVEFYNNAGFKGSLNNYKPFSLRTYKGEAVK